jgi:hypothetical protein
MRVGLIACSKTKLDHPVPAEELYQGQLFKLAKPWIIRHVVDASKKGEQNEWGILSAKHGLVMPDQVLKPYDFALSDLKAGPRKAWEETVYRQLMKRWGDKVIYTVLAGFDYRQPVKRMPMCEDVIECWTQWRRDRGMTNRRASMSIGLIKKALKEDQGYY